MAEYNFVRFYLSFRFSINYKNISKFSVP